MASRPWSRTYIDGGQEMNRRQRRVGDEYAIGGIHLQSLRNTCRYQVYCILNTTYPSRKFGQASHPTFLNRATAGFQASRFATVDISSINA
jgi:hypothetical protein